MRLQNTALTVAKEIVIGRPKPNALQDAVFLSLRSDPFALKPGSRYILSFWARTDVEHLSVWHAVQPDDTPPEPIVDQFYEGKRRPYEQVVDVGGRWRQVAAGRTDLQDAAARRTGCSPLDSFHGQGHALGG